jgi:hypothetical protein
MERLYRLDREVTACRACNAQPKAVLRYGKNTHHLECCPCMSRTAPFPSLAEAIAAWDRQEQVAVQIVKRPRLSLAR